MVTSDQGRNLIAPRIGERDGHQRRSAGKEDRKKQKAIDQIGKVAVYADIRGIFVAGMQGHGAAFVGLTNPQDEAAMRYSQGAGLDHMIDDRNRQLDE